MQLHWTKGEPDWVSVPVAERNTWQRLAAQTRSVITPGNALTILGVGVVIVSLWQIQLHHYWLGIVLLAIGRSFDVLDGLAAHKTGTKSPTGEMLDAGFDKIIGLVAGIMLVTAHILAPLSAILLVGLHLIISVLAIGADLTHTRLHPSRNGKLCMAASWLALGSFVVSTAFGYSHRSVPYWLGYVFVGTALVLGTLAIREYVKTIRRA